MDIVISRGCTSFYTLVDGVRLEELTPAQLEQAVDRMVARIRRAYRESGIYHDGLVGVLPHANYESDDEPCDQCGDYVSTTTWVLAEIAGVAPALKVEVLSGCTAGGTVINGKRLEHIEQTKQAELFDQILAHVREAVLAKRVPFTELVELIECDDLQSVGGACDCCGDRVSRATWHLD